MPGWTPAELSRISQADELDLASERRDGSLRHPVTMWVVRDGDDLYVRSMHGTAGAWFRGTQTRHQGHIRSGGIDKDVMCVVNGPHSYTFLNQQTVSGRGAEVPTVNTFSRRRWPIW